MEYEIRVRSGQDVLGDPDELHDDPRSALRELEYLRKQFPSAQFEILRDGVVITEAQLNLEITSFEIGSVREETSRMPSTYRHGRGTGHDDVAESPDGTPVKVWGPDNPEDRFD